MSKEMKRPEHSGTVVKDGTVSMYNHEWLNLLKYIDYLESKQLPGEEEREAEIGRYNSGSWYCKHCGNRLEN